jgi:hypothetical protein
MAMAPGDKIIVVPTGLSQKTCVKLDTPAVDEVIAAIPTDGKTVSVPIGPLNVGSKLVFVPDTLGNYIPLRAAGSKIPITIGETQIISLGDGILLSSYYASRYIWRSIDYGQKWIRYDLTPVLGSGRKIWRLLLLESGTVLLVTDSSSTDDGDRMSVFKSEDDGLTWSFSWEMPVDEDSWLVHPASFQKYGSNIYIAGYGKIKVWKSTNSGSSFTEMLDLGYGNAAMAVCPDEGYITVAEDGGTNMGHVWLSSNDGVSWSDVYYYGTIIDPYNNENADAKSCTVVDGTYVASVIIYGTHTVHGEGIWVMRDASHGAGSHSETQINPPTTHSYYFWYMYRIPATTKLVGLAGTSSTAYSLYTSADGGSSWTKRASAPLLRTCWYVSDLGGGTLLGVDHDGYLYSSDDDGASWDIISTYEG